MTLILNGKVVRDSIEKDLKSFLLSCAQKPKLAIVQVGDRADSTTYIKQKILFGKKIGVEVEHVQFEEQVTEKEIIEHIEKLNTDTNIHGIIVQIPLPAHLNKNNIIESIDPKKDVDGLTAHNTKKLWENAGGLVPATARGVVELLEYYKIEISGKNVVVVGRSTLVGKPIALSLINKNATVTMCHSHTKNLADTTKQADILIVAIGKPLSIHNKHVHEDQVVVDVGINLVSGKKLDEEIPQTKLVGDVDFETVAPLVKAISPVPGGVGPMTVACLFQNLCDAYKCIAKNKNML